MSIPVPWFDVMVKQLPYAHSIPGHSRPMERPHLTWMDAVMHYMGSRGHTLQIDLPRDWANLHCTGTCGGGWSAGAELRAVFFCPFCCFAAGGLDCGFCVFVIGWRHALWSERVASGRVAPAGWGVGWAWGAV